LTEGAASKGIATLDEKAMRWSKMIRWLAVALLAAAPGFAFAQTPSSAKRPAPHKTAPGAAAAPGASESGPSATTAVYGDWVVRCSQQVQGRICEVAQPIYIQGQQNPIALIAIGREKANEPIQMVLQVPVNVTVSARAKVALKDGEPLIELNFERCVPTGCFAMVQPADEVVRRLREHSGPSRLTYKDASGKEVGFQFSLRGLASALEAWAKG
jgi:invasion protein IalB